MSSIQQLPGTAPVANPYADGCAWIEGSFVPIAQARIPITDTGFTRSDCTYDVVAAWQRRLFRLDLHLARFARSCAALRLAPPLAPDAIRRTVIECVRLTGLADAYVEMIATRGVPPPGERDPRRFANRFYAFAIPYVWIVQPDDQLAGTHLVIARGTRRIEPESVDPTVKNFHWGDLVRGLLEAYDRGGATALLLNAAGEVTEGPGFNVFALADRTLWTPARGVLQGVTRQTVLELAPELGLATREAMFGPERLAAAEEVFITSTAGGVMPVTMLDGRPIGTGAPGPVTLALRRRYWDAHTDPRWSVAIDD
jgi:branched-chain amino acid aminotransferase